MCTHITHIMYVCMHAFTCAQTFHSLTDKYTHVSTLKYVHTYVHATHTQLLWCHSCSTLGRAWLSMKGELAERSKAHSTFAANVSGHISDFNHTRTHTHTHTHTHTQGGV